MEHDNTSSLKDAIKVFLEDYNLRERFVQTRVTTDWEKIVGKTIARHTMDIYIKQGVLHLYLDSAPLKQELNIAKSKLLERINEAIGEKLVSEIIIR